MTLTAFTKEQQSLALRQCIEALKDDDNPYVLKALHSTVVGSTYINGSGQDIDCLILVPACDLECIGFQGWQYGGSVGEGNESHWGSWMKGSVNMLLTTSKEYYEAWLTAAEVCRFLHLRNVQITKGERLAIHNILMDDSTADEQFNDMKDPFDL